MDTPNSSNQFPSAGPPSPATSGGIPPTSDPQQMPEQNIPQEQPQNYQTQPLQQQWREQPPIQPAAPTNRAAQDPYGTDRGSTQVQAPSAPEQAPQFEQPAQDQAASQPTQNPDQMAAEQSSQQPPIQDQYQESAFIPGMAKPQPEEILFEWQAESRPFLQRRRKHFTTIGLICVLIAMILFFAGQMLPVAVIIAVFFLYYVLNSTPPGIITHQFTTYGIRIEDTLYYWEEFGRFWFTEKFGKPLLHIEIERFPFRLTLLLGDISKDDMQAVLSEVLLFQVPSPTTYEKVAKWIQEKLPIDMDAD